MNQTVIQQSRSGTVKPLIAHRLKQVISRAELAHLLEIQARADTVWKERSEFASAPRLIENARATLRDHPTAENREILDDLTNKFGTREYCGNEEDIRISNLASIEREVPAAVFPVLRRVLSVLGDIRDEMADAERRAFEHVGFTYNDDVDGGPVLLLVIEVAHRLNELIGRIKRNQNIIAQSPSAALECYFDLATVKKENLLPTLPVIPDEQEAVVISPREQAFRDSINKPPPLIDRATSRPVKPPIPGMDFPAYSGGQPTQFSSDGEFSKTMGRLAQLPSRI